MAGWLANFYRDEGSEARLRFGFQTSCWMSQYQFGQQESRQVRANWEQARRVRIGDLLIARLTSPARVFAVGRVISPRNTSKFHDKIQRTLEEGTHLIKGDFILYDDAQAFYEDLRFENGFDGQWGQRIDVDSWHLCAQIPDGIPQPPGAPTGYEGFMALSSVDNAFSRATIAALGGTTMDYEDMTNIGDSQIFSISSQVILSGPPGTSKTHRAKQITSSLLGFSSPTDPGFIQARFRGTGSKQFAGSWDIVQFHPSYNYEDFVRGIASEATPQGVKYETVNRTFAEMCLLAKESDAKHVLIIDEVNRANVAAVFGELLYALEYRGEAVSTPYAVGAGDKTLTVPRNLFIIGTMNTADRSIGHIDYAIRRRFAFLECKPERRVIERHLFTNPETKELALRMFDRVASLFQGDLLSADHSARNVQVGHTYFIDSDETKLRMKLRFQVVPLLNEYLADGVFHPKAKQQIDELLVMFGAEV